MKLSSILRTLIIPCILVASTPNIQAGSEEDLTHLRHCVYASSLTALFGGILCYAKGGLTPRPTFSNALIITMLSGGFLVSGLSGLALIGCEYDSKNKSNSTSTSKAIAWGITMPGLIGGISSTLYFATRA